MELLFLIILSALPAVFLAGAIRWLTAETLLPRIDRRQLRRVTPRHIIDQLS
jgi:hypothetical protein